MSQKINRCVTAGQSVCFLLDGEVCTAINEEYIIAMIVSKTCVGFKRPVQ